MKIYWKKREDRRPEPSDQAEDVPFSAEGRSLWCRKKKKKKHPVTRAIQDEIRMQNRKTSALDAEELDGKMIGEWNEQWKMKKSRERCWNHLAAQNELQFGAYQLG